MTQQSAVLLIAFLAGLVVAAVLLGTARRNVLPRPAMVIAALAIPIWVVYFSSSQGRSLLASKGFLSAMPEALWFGLTFGVFTAAFFLALGYIYGDAKRRQMPAWALQFLRQAYSRGRSILLTLRMLAGFQYRTHHS